MNRHIWVNRERIQGGHATVKSTDGIELYVEVSPYSVPRGIFGRYDSKKGEFVIEFRYIDDEKPSAKRWNSGGVFIIEGKYSRKLLSIIIPIDNGKFSSVNIIKLQTKIVDALHERVRELTPDVTGGPDRLNQEVAEELLDEKNLRYLTGELVG